MPKKIDFLVVRADFGSETDYFGFNKVVFGLLGLIIDLKEPDLGLRGWGDVCTDIQIDINSLLCPEGYQPFWGRCPKTELEAYDHNYGCPILLLSIPVMIST